ncbi:MAG: hypothetical protein U9O94_08330 [Nanoarchaeota archaeon]|nr:hypothetical protein [Nanoarchaeota archaeon]
MEFHELKKEEFDLLSSILDFKGLKCGECGKLITRDNFGIIHKDYACCNELLCQIATLRKRGED